MGSKRSGRYCMLILVVVGAWISAGSNAAHAADWPHFRGPNRNGISSETAWNAQFGSNPRKLWTAQVGEGYSSMAIVGGRLYTMGNAGNQDTIWCLDAMTGRVVWKYSYPHEPGGAGYSGPRATPTVADGRVYTLSNLGRAFCLDAANGRVIWQADLRAQTGAAVPQWGFAGSPLVEGGLVIYNLGEAGTAVDKATGRIRWKSGSGPSGYATPVPYVLGGRRLVVIFGAKSVFAVDPATGRKTWEHPWNTMYDVNAADPQFAGTDVFISSNYNRGGALLRTASGRPQVVWENREMRTHFNAVVIVGGHLYGNDEGRLRCVDLRTGAGRWEMRGMGKGGVIAAGGKLIGITERGELFTAEATPMAFREISRAQVLRGTCWTQPALANGIIYVRSHEGELAAIDVRK